VSVLKFQTNGCRRKVSLDDIHAHIVRTDDHEI
jgi:hypothetical protein